MDGFTETDIKFYRHLIQSNVIQAVHQLIEAARNLDILIDDKEMVFVAKFKKNISLNHSVILQRLFQKILKNDGSYP